jgi:hypothetical protein
VAGAGSFSAAAREMKLSQASATKQISNPIHARLLRFITVCEQSYADPPAYCSRVSTTPPRNGDRQPVGGMVQR